MIVRCLNLYSFSLSHPIPHIDGEEGLECRVLHTPISLLFDAIAEEAARRRFANDNICSCLSYKNRIVSYCWVAFREEWIGEIEAFIKPKDGEAYLFDAFTIPEYRGKGFFCYLLTCTLSYLKSLDYRRALIFALRSNRASNRAIQNAGFEHFQTVRFIKLWRKNICFIKKNSSCHPPILFQDMGNRHAFS